MDELSGYAFRVDVLASTARWFDTVLDAGPDLWLRYIELFALVART